MVLEAGTRLGPYEVTAQIGRGGMGEVYRARDTNLDRDVAIKVLPDAFANDPDRLARFQREAKVLASLNHPNIAAIYGLEDSGETHALVLELVEGPTLQDRISQGPIPLDEALPIAKQIAEALEAAHEQGIIHRDLKPANIKVTPDGVVKVLDFGLAKALEPERTEAEAANSPTMTAAATKMGVLMGTAAYMSPEQACGKPLDRRADVWAFGVVLYEMLTGTVPFRGDDITSTLAEVVKSEPSWALLPPGMSPALVTFLRRCLEKPPRQRVQAIGDVRLAMEGAFESALPAASGAATSASPRWQRLNLAIAGVLVGGLAAALVTGAVVTSPSAPRQVQQFDVFPPEGATLNPGEVPALSPDGRSLAFVATAPSGSTLLWVRPLRSREARPIAGTEGATFPFWSPDGRSLAFFANAQLNKIAIDGGPAERLAAATPYPRGGAWSSHGVLLFSPGLDTPLYQVSEDGGPSTAVTTIDSSRSEVSHRLPTFLPGGRRFLFVIQSGVREVTGLHWGSLDSANVERVGDIQSKAHFADSGHLVYAREQTLVARGFDPDRLEFTGEPQVLANDVAGRVGVYAERGFSVSTNGILAHWTGGSLQTEMAWFDRNGVKQESVGEPGLHDGVKLSPDGTRLAYERWDPENRRYDIWVHDMIREIGSPFALRNDCCPVWSPDGQRIAYGSLRDGPADIYRRSTLGAEDEELLFESEAFVIPVDWSLDGRFIVYMDTSATDVGVLPVGDGDERTPRPTLESAAAEINPRLSPDLHWLAYESNESGTWEVWLQSFPELDTKIQVSRGGGSHPEWRRDGKELFYLAPDRSLMAVELTGDDVLQPGTPQALFSSRALGHVGKQNYDLSPDGQRFLMIVPVGEVGSSPITVTLNWDAELKARVPTN